MAMRMMTTCIKAASVALVAASIAGCGSQGESGGGEGAGTAAQASKTEFHSVEARTLAEDRGISWGEAELRLHWQLKAPRLEEDAARQLSSAFGGLWIDVNDGDRIKLGVVKERKGAEKASDSNPEVNRSARGAASNTGAGSVEGGTDSTTDALATARALIEHHGLTEAADIVQVDYSLDELEAVNAWMSAKLVELGRDNTLIAGLRTDLNAVRVSTNAGLPATAREASVLAEAFASFGDRVVLDTHEAAPGPQAGCADLPNYGWVCDPSLRGGIRIRSSGGCTGAFIARSRVDDKLYQFTAGHCVDTDSGTWSTRFTNNSTHNVGAPHNFHYGASGDMAIIRVNNVAGWDLPNNWVHVTDGADTSQNEEYTINSEGSSTIGMRICITGATSNASDCGDVTDLNVTYTNTEGVTVTNSGRANYCSLSGDSGAPLYASHVSYGIHNAAIGSCDTFYTGIKGAENLMNVDVLH